ncbi:MAG: cyclase family protein [Planctomycetes bacterium]|nr:cyclase family protein [Planctomycetota bacterium]
MSLPSAARATAIIMAALIGLTLPGERAAFPQEKKNGGEGEKSETPIGSVWWPSPFGADDQRGAANRITPERVVAASKLIKEGKIYSLGHVYEQDMPLYGKRHFSLTIPGSPTGGPFGKNRLVYHDEMFSGEIGQIGTQLDGLGHIGVRMGGDDYFYNGFKRSEFGKAYGLEKLGIENVGVFFNRGVLVDVAGFKGVKRMQIGDVVTVADLEGALKKQGVEVREGDVVLFRTGHAQLWKVNNELYNRGEPGIGVAAAKWLCERKIVMVGSDTWATEVVPNENTERAFEVHQLLLVRNGIYNLENLNLEELARNNIYEFAFIFAPLPLKGASGSPGNPIAVR